MKTIQCQTKNVSDSKKFTKVWAHNRRDEKVYYCSYHKQNITKISTREDTKVKETWQMEVEGKWLSVTKGDSLWDKNNEKAMIQNSSSDKDTH